MSINSLLGFISSEFPSEARTDTSEISSLETVIYNLDMELDKQLQGVISIDVTDSKSASKVAPIYADAILKQLK